MYNIHTDKIIELLATNEQKMTPARFRAYKSSWVLQLKEEVATGNNSVDVVALLENIRDSFLGE